MQKHLTTKAVNPVLC